MQEKPVALSYMVAGAVIAAGLFNLSAHPWIATIAVLVALFGAWNTYRLDTDQRRRSER